MAVSLDVRSGKAEKKLDKLARDAGVTVGFVVEDQMRLWLNDIIRQAPPKVLKQGRATVEQDLQRLFEPIDDKAAITAWKKRAAESGGDVFVQTKSGRMRIDAKKLKATTLSRMRKVHKANRRKTDGRVFIRTRRRDEAWDGQFLVPKVSFRRYVRETQQRVGLLKSRFGVAALHYARESRGTTPAYKNWIKKHTAGGSFGGRMRFGTGYISATNDADYAAEQMVTKGWWPRTRHRRERDIEVGVDKRAKDIVRRFNAGSI